MNYYQFAVNTPLNGGVLTYLSKDSIEPGSWVTLPLGKRSVLGITLEKAQPEEEIDYKEVGELIDDLPKFDHKLLELLMWMSRYYHYPLGQLCHDVSPNLKFILDKGLEKGSAKLLKLLAKEKDANLETPSQIILTPAQEKITNEFLNSLTGFSQKYLWGITGAGKSVIYLKLMQEVLKTRSVQLLLPEINLTPQFVSFFEKELSVPVYAYHSGLTPNQKLTTWLKAQTEERPALYLGVRSSLFLNSKNLGLIIVDEEHDDSFKQSDRCPYHARDVAIKKAQNLDIPIIMGSATPSLESYNRFYKEKNSPKLFERVGKSKLPEIKILDQRGVFKQNPFSYPIVPSALDEIKARLAKGEQVLVFINKLGYSHYLQCRQCGHQFKNEKCGCDHNLRYFKQKAQLDCAHCDFVAPAPKVCPSCGSVTLNEKGFGTERVQEVLQKELPDYVIERFDRDEITTFKKLQAKLDDFNEMKSHVLVGTQMLSKGHNFKRVNLVLVLGIDQMLSFSDFRANEKAYSQLVQISGRAGRFGDQAEVLIQTLQPENKLFKYLKDNAIEDFYQEELKLRSFCECPPYSKMAMIFFSAKDRDTLHSESTRARRLFDNLPKETFDRLSYFGPTPMQIEKRAQHFTWAMMVKSTSVNQLHQAISFFDQNFKSNHKLKLKIDIDPQTIL